MRLRPKRVENEVVRAAGEGYIVHKPLSPRFHTINYLHSRRVC